MQLKTYDFLAASRTVAEGIVMEYCDDGASSKISLTKSLRNQLLASLRTDDGNVTSNLLKAACDEMQGKIEQDSLLPFVHGEAFALLLHALSRGHEFAEISAIMTPPTCIARC